MNFEKKLVEELNKVAHDLDQDIMRVLEKYGFKVQSYNDYAIWINHSLATKVTISNNGARWIVSTVDDSIPIRGEGAIELEKLLKKIYNYLY